MHRSCDIRYKKLIEGDRYKYVLVASPTRALTVVEMKGDTLKELWEKLWAYDLVDKARYTQERSNELKELRLAEETYKEYLEQYMLNELLHYKKCNW